MTRKQFLKLYGLNQPRDKEPYLAVVKKYKGYLSYFRLHLLIRAALMLRRYGPEPIISYVEAVIDGQIKRKKEAANT